MDRVQQIAAATKNARPTPQNPSWYHTHNDLVYVLGQLTAANKAIVALSEALDGLKNPGHGVRWDHNLLGRIECAKQTLKTHADTIKRAKESA